MLQNLSAYENGLLQSIQLLFVLGVTLLISIELQFLSLGL